MGLNESLNRHPWNKANVVQARNLGRRQRNAHRIVGLRRLERVLLSLVSREIGGDAREPTAITGVVRWLPARTRTTASAPMATWSMSEGDTRLHHQLVGAGTICMMVSPLPITPPTVCTASWCTKPACGARRSTRLSWSSAAVTRSLSSAILPCASRNP